MSVNLIDNAQSYTYSASMTSNLASEAEEGTGEEVRPLHAAEPSDDEESNEHPSGVGALVDVRA